MVAFAEDNASNRPRKIFAPKKSTGTLVRDWLGQLFLWGIRDVEIEIFERD